MADPRQMPPTWRELVDAVGGRAALAELCSVSEVTIWRWSQKETTPTRLVRESVNKIAASHGVQPVFEE